MSTTIDYYRRQAALCQEWAEQTSIVEVAAEYRRLALAWLRLANLARQIESSKPRKTGE